LSPHRTPGWEQLEQRWKIGNVMDQVPIVRKWKMKINRLLYLLVFAMSGPVVAGNAEFTGGHSARFSDPSSWSRFPEKGDHITVSADATSADSPAVVDSAFVTALGLVRIYSTSAMGIGTACVEIQENAVLKALAVIVGNPANKAFDGRLVVSRGAGVEPSYANSGQLQIGGDESGMDGEVIVRAGAQQLSHAALNIGKSGTLTFEFGASNVTPFSVTQRIRPGTNQLDGRIVVNLAELRQAGRYELVDGSDSQVSIGGALSGWLDESGGAVLGTGDFQSDHFAVTGGGTWPWRLTVENNDLVLYAGDAEEKIPAHTELPPKKIFPPPIDDTTWDLASWREWPFDYEELSVREAPLLTDSSADWIHAGDSWVAENTASGKKTVQKPIESFDALQITDFYITGGGNENGPNRIFCASAVPAGIDGPFPVLFVFHGGGGHASGALALSVARNNPGFAAVAVDYNGQYRASNDPVTQWVTVTPELKERKLDLVPNPLNFSMAHYAQAARRVLDWTGGQSWADPEKFGAVGISYGGWVSFFLAGNDERIRSVWTAVSAAGTEGMRGRATQPHDWQPADQVDTWIQHADPIQYAAKTGARVFMRIAADDRFFWLDGAARHRECFPKQAQWLVLPNSDHGNGGPDLPDPGGLWHRAVYMDGASFPTFGKPVLPGASGKSVSIPVESGRPLKSVHLAWAPGDEVSVARYWRWISTEQNGDLWSANLPDGFEDREAVLYFTAIDADGRAVSSDLIHKPGRTIDRAVEWRDGCLWDLASGADAWRSDLSFGRCSFETRADGRVCITPVKAGKKSVFFTNSLMIPEGERSEHKGIRIELDGNGAASVARILLVRDLLSLAEQKFSAGVEIPASQSVLELSWEQFRPEGNGTAQESLLPVNALAIEVDVFGPEGITVGRVLWLD
jgi:dienelactone hydrolase